MAEPTRDNLFKPNQTKAESKADAVSRIARSMIDEEIAKRDAKTARLKEARLALEAAASPAKLPKSVRPARVRRAK
jgi:hypothetical protein